MQEILIIENKTEILDELSKKLSYECFNVNYVTEDTEALRLCKSKKYDLIITMLFEKDITPVAYINMLQIISPTTPIIVVASNDQACLELDLLNIDIEDFMLIPMEVEILYFRVKKILNRLKISSNNIYDTYNDMIVELDNRRVIKSGIEIKLTRREFDLLVYFLKNPNVVLPRTKIEEDVWGSSYKDVISRSIDIYVLRLRRKLNIDSIEAVRSIGYEWIGEK